LADILEQRLALISTAAHAPHLGRINRGIEKEGLRTTLSGQLAQTPHPEALGAALTHPSITTDYSEALLEFITPVFDRAELALDNLNEIHAFCYSQLQDELIWATSMPCFLGGEDAIPIARYGRSNVGMLRHVYRVGLAHRYGKMMQTIAGIHYNFSLPESFWSHYQQDLREEGDLVAFQTAQYFALIRNFRRYAWLILYLFGASPALCPSFLQGRAHRLHQLKGKTLYEPYGTSLRMGDLGYQNSAQQALNVCYNTLDSYVATLGQAIHTPHPAYAKIGTKVGGRYRQLNSNVLQIENEYYSDIRPKRVTPSGRKPLAELSQRGVQYVELRNIDINPFVPSGIDADQSRFLDCFALYCLLRESPYESDAESTLLNHNKTLVVNSGRKPGLELIRGDRQRQRLTDWGNEIFEQLYGIGEALDHAHGSRDFTTAINHQREKLETSDATPSARIINTLKDQGISFFEFGLTQSEAHRRYFKAHPPSTEQNMAFRRAATASLHQQQEIEANDQLSFDQFLAQYLAD